MENLRIVMPYQLEAFNGDNFIKEKFLELKIKHNLNKAIETGSCWGSTTLWLLQNFSFVATIENSEEFYSVMLKRCESLSDRLLPVFGSSSDCLYSIITGIKDPDRTIFFLDAHWEKDCPLLSELKQIADAGIRPVIAIHDWKVPGENLGFDIYNSQPFEFEWIKSSIEAIYGNDYKISYNSEAKSEGAKRGIIYIEPC